MSFLAFNLSSIFGFVTNLDKMSVEELLEANAKKILKSMGVMLEMKSWFNLLNLQGYSKERM